MTENNENGFQYNFRMCTNIYEEWFYHTTARTNKWPEYFFTTKNIRSISSWGLFKKILTRPHWFSQLAALSRLKSSIIFVLYCIVSCRVVLCCVVLRCAVLYWVTVLCCIGLDCTVLLHCVVLYWSGRDWSCVYCIPFHDNNGDAFKSSRGIKAPMVIQKYIHNPNPFMS